MNRERFIWWFKWSSDKLLPLKMKGCRHVQYLHLKWELDNKTDSIVRERRTRSWYESKKNRSSIFTLSHVNLLRFYSWGIDDQIRTPSQSVVNNSFNLVHEQLAQTKQLWITRRLPARSDSVSLERFVELKMK